VKINCVTQLDKLDCRVRVSAAEQGWYAYRLCNERASECCEGADHKYRIPSTECSTCAVTIACAWCRALRRQLHHMCQLNILWLLFCVIFLFYILVSYTKFRQ
jgi:hypothetical protein